MHNILVTGANVQIGNEIRQRASLLASQALFHFTDVEELDITPTGIAVDDFIREHAIDIYD